MNRMFKGVERTGPKRGHNRKPRVVKSAQVSIKAIGNPGDELKASLCPSARLAGQGVGDGGWGGMSNDSVACLINQQKCWQHSS